MLYALVEEITNDNKDMYIFFAGSYSILGLTLLSARILQNIIWGQQIFKGRLAGCVPGKSLQVLG